MWKVWQMSKLHSFKDQVHTLSLVIPPSKQTTAWRRISTQNWWTNQTVDQALSLELHLLEQPGESPGQPWLNLHSRPCFDLRVSVTLISCSFLLTQQACVNYFTEPPKNDSVPTNSCHFTKQLGEITVLWSYCAKLRALKRLPIKKIIIPFLHTTYKLFILYRFKHMPRESHEKPLWSRPLLLINLSYNWEYLLIKTD